ncbi:cytochrome c-type biogenesis protein [Halochromatium glycolicum]|uniref:Cytochrome c-type biogenesis protein n=1 Tax=Halochromatium glycolicum TaxID=85075 RepID=A0AAJ0U2D3_9GAMM|nr:cytochrome c-type biogenesis protein [Halochromatium glycolicum]MBK1704003.1 cytochrome C biogenesis protein [Halochromatium glycolicum]
MTRPTLPLLPTALLLASLLSGLLFGGVAAAYTLEEFEFDSPAQQEQFRELIGKLRCLVCQNESLAGSQAELAQDLRNEVYEMMRAGQSEDAILDFLVARYGDFVLYDPPLKPSTYLLWFGPFVLIGIGAVVVIRTLLSKKTTPDQPVTEADRARIDELLNADQTADQTADRTADRD